MSGYWTIVAFHAKLFGMSIANGGLRSPPLVWARPTGEIADIFARLHDALLDQWGRYSDFDEGANREIARLCHALMEADARVTLHAHEGDREDEMQVGSQRF